MEGEKVIVVDVNHSDGVPYPTYTCFRGDANENQSSIKKILDYHNRNINLEVARRKIKEGYRLRYCESDIPQLLKLGMLEEELKRGEMIPI